MLFYVVTGPLGTVAIQDLETGERTDPFEGATPTFAASGHLVFWREDSLWTVPSDQDSLEVQGNPVLMVDGVESYTVANVAAYSIADNGTLVYRPATSAAGALGWVNRDGEMTSVLVEGLHNATPALSPDGTRVAFRRPAMPSGEDLWIWNLSRGSETKLTETRKCQPDPNLDARRKMLDVQHRSWWRHPAGDQTGGPQWEK